MSGTLPNNKFLNVVISSNTPTITTTSVSGMRQSKQIATQFWTIEADYVPLNIKESKEIMGFLAKQRNSLYDFDVVVPNISHSSGSVNDVIASNPALNTLMTVTSDVSAGNNTLSFDTAINSSYFTDLNVDASEGLVSGDFITFTGHNKVYQVLDNVDFNGTGGGTFTVFPNLMSNISSGEEIIYNDVPFVVYNTQSAQDIGFTLGDTTEITLTLQESI
jgi:hypothetical protein